MKTMIPHLITGSKGEIAHGVVSYSAHFAKPQPLCYSRSSIPVEAPYLHEEVRLMTPPAQISLATLVKVASSLAQSSDESFVLIYRDKARDDWGLELTQGLEGLLVANVLNAFQGKLLESLLEQQQRIAPNSPKKFDTV
jgi:hypothetical protein